MTAELIFGKYEIVRRLAIGGMGEVFEAAQRGGVLDRPVILKSLLPDVAKHEGSIEQFLDEARVAATLNHPNVVSIFEVGLWNGTYFIAMELIRGRDLGRLIRASLAAQLPIPPGVVARVVRDAALGLEHAHHATAADGRPLGIVHRDISPQNIMVRDDGVTKVVDFGIAWASNRETRTATGAVKGKIAYMAPEQLHSRSVTHLTDQFALGIVLWELCTRRRLFTAEHPYELAKKVLEAPIPPLGTLAPDLPPGLAAIAARMLQRDEALRFPSCAEVAKSLDEVLLECGPMSEGGVAQWLAALQRRAPPEPLVTPSAGNFVVSLNGATATSVPATSPRLERRWGLITLSLVVGAGAGALVLWWPARPGPVAPPPVARVAPAAVESAPAPGVDARAMLEVITVPPGASVEIDGRAYGPAPLQASVRGGRAVHLRAQKPGFGAGETDVTVSPGAQQTVTLELQRVQPVPAPPRPPPRPSAETGLLTVETDPWTMVSVDSGPAHESPLWRHVLSAGRHHLEMVTQDGARAERDVDIVPGQPVVLKLRVP